MNQCQLRSLRAAFGVGQRERSSLRQEFYLTSERCSSSHDGFRAQQLVKGKLSPRWSRLDLPATEDWNLALTVLLRQGDLLMKIVTV